jgi:hypothetical protein
MASIEILSRNLPGGTEDRHGQPRKILRCSLL